MYTYNPAFNDRTDLVDGEGSGRKGKRQKSNICVESKQKPHTVLLAGSPSILVAPTGDNDGVEQKLQIATRQI